MSAEPRSSANKPVPAVPVSSFDISVQSLPIWRTSKGDPTASLRTRFGTSVNTSPTAHAGDTLGMRSPWPVTELTPKPRKGKPEPNTRHVNLTKPIIQSAKLDSNSRAAVRARRTATAARKPGQAKLANGGARSRIKPDLVVTHDRSSNLHCR